MSREILFFVYSIIFVEYCYVMDSVLKGREFSVLLITSFLIRYTDNKETCIDFFEHSPYIFYLQLQGENQAIR